MLTKDQRIRYRRTELDALQSGHIFCLAKGNLPISQALHAFATAIPAIERAVARTDRGFWKVYTDGELRQTWP